MQQEFGPKRSKETTKPKVTCPKTIFYSCSECGNIYQGIKLNERAIPGCCDKKMKPLIEKSYLEVAEEILIDYKIIGGYNDNVVEVYWKTKSDDVLVEWVYLKTFTGGQLKYVNNIKKSSSIFAMADEDAYVYCDENPCLECTFRCKRGFEIYVYIKEKGLVKIPLERMHANWHS